MTENKPLGPEEFRQLNRDLMEKVLDKAASDKRWKQRLLDHPEAAMLEADFSEAKKLQEAQALSLSQEAEEEVHGHARGDLWHSFWVGCNLVKDPAVSRFCEY